MATIKRQQAVSTRGYGTMVASTGQRVNAGRGERVGFYGCWHLDRIVRVGSHRSDGHWPRNAQVRCPCGLQHKTHIQWRNLGRSEMLRAETWVYDPPKEEA